MRTITTLFVLLLMASTLQAEPAVAMRLLNTYQQKEYQFVITQADLDRSPAWEENQDAAPLAPRAAVESARRYAMDDLLRKVRPSQQWLMRRITIEHVGGRENQWIYIIDFIPEQGDAVLLTALPVFRIPVLMDGTVPRANVTLARSGGRGNQK